MESVEHRVSLSELKKTLARDHEGQKIVHCHGVFDLLHIGHIRHLKEARKMGDLLVVTVTPDAYVNRGPGRPVFNEELRVEALAAFDWIDYVALTESPTAVEAISSIRPAFYVKGAPPIEKAAQASEQLAAEEQAVIAVGGKLAFTHEVRFSSSNLLNHHFPVFPPEVREYLSAFSMRHATRGVQHYLDEAKGLKVLVVGEAIVDEYQYCRAIGKSSKEPTLVVTSETSEKFAGGVLAVANHLSDFCDEVGVITFLGDSNSQEAFVDQKLGENIKRHFLYKEDSPTIVKRRYVDSYFFTKLLEVYEINDSPLNEANDNELCTLLAEQIPEYDIVIVLDFGHGMMSQKARKLLVDLSQFLALNVQANAGNLGYHTISSYEHADYISIAENEIRLEARDRQSDVQQLMLESIKKLGCNFMSITRGKQGSLCYSVDAGMLEVPALASKVVDRIGAGDAFLAITSLCVAQGAPMDVVGFVGNAAGALAVATVGNREKIERQALKTYIDTLLKH